MQWIPQHTLPGLVTHAKGIISPDGQFVVAAGWDRTVRAYELKAGKEVVRLEGFQGLVKTAIFSSNGRSLLTSSTTHRAANPDSEYLKSLQGDGTVRIWDFDFCCEVFKLDFGELNHSVFSPDGRYVFANVPLDCTGRT